MRSMRPLFFSAILLTFFDRAQIGLGQPPQGPGEVKKDQKPRKPPDETRAILEVIEEAYKAPREVDKDILEEIRKQYNGPTPDRETKIIREIRRLYFTTVEIEDVILKEIRRAYEQPTYEQEDKIFREIRRGGQLPPGTVSSLAQNYYAIRLFRKLDQDNNGTLDADEMPENMRVQSGRWDRNLDGLITLEEYVPYYQASLKEMSQKVSSGEIYLKAAQPATSPNVTPTSNVPPTSSRVEEARPMITRVGKLPDGLPKWFVECDTDRDGQVGLDEWVKAGGSITEFRAMDRNDDGLLEAAELLHFLTEQPKTSSTKP